MPIVQSNYSHKSRSRLTLFVTNRRAFQKLPLREMTEDEVRALFTKFDFDSSGALDRDEFRDLMRALRKENAKKAKVARPRMDQVERRNVRDVAAMAEVRLGKLPPKERDVAMASIMCFVNEGRFEQTPPVRTGGVATARTMFEPGDATAVLRPIATAWTLTLTALHTTARPSRLRESRWALKFAPRGYGRRR